MKSTKSMESRKSMESTKSMESWSEESTNGKYSNSMEIAVDYNGLGIDTIFPGPAVKKIVKKTQTEIKRILESLGSNINIPRDGTSSILNLIEEYQTGIVPPGLVSAIRDFIIKYERHISKRSVTEIKKMQRKCELQLGLEKSLQIIAAYERDMGTSLTEILKKLQGCYMDARKTEMVIKEIVEYLRRHSSSLSTKIVRVCIQMFHSYGFYSFDKQFERIIKSERYTGATYITEESLLKMLIETNSAKFEVNSVEDCNPQMYCTSGILDKICPFGGGTCSATYSYRGYGGEEKVSCTISITDCAPKPSVQKLTVTEIIYHLKKSGTCRTWVDFAEECNPQYFCLSPSIIKEVAPNGGGKCLTQVRGKVCTITWQGMTKVQKSYKTNFKSWREVNIRKGAIQPNGIDFTVIDAEQCEQFCTDMVDNYDTDCRGTSFQCCVKITTQAYGIKICNVKHKCSSGYNNRGVREPVSNMNAEDLNSKDEELDIPSIPAEVISVNKTIYLNGNGEKQGSDYSGQVDHQLQSDIEKSDESSEKPSSTNRIQINKSNDTKIKSEVITDKKEIKDINIHIKV